MIRENKVLEVFENEHEFMNLVEKADGTYEVTYYGKTVKEGKTVPFPDKVSAYKAYYVIRR